MKRNPPPKKRSGYSLLSKTKRQKAIERGKAKRKAFTGKK